MLKKMKRAQIFSGEFLLAYFIFMLVLTLAFYLWTSTTREIIDSERISRIEQASVDVAEQFIRTTGVPEDWSGSNVQVIGLAEESRVLSDEKLLTFVEMMNSTNYESNRHLLGLGRYNFYFNVTNLSASTINISNTMIVTGALPENETEKLTIVRTAILNETIVRVILTVWE